MTKLQELELETLVHSPYSSDLDSTDYHFLDNFSQGKLFKNQEEVKNTFVQFIESHGPEFYSSEINKLPLK